jgi:hypothetical protein
MGKIITQDIAKNRCENLGFELISKYTSSKNIHDIQCHCGAVFSSRISSIWNGHTTSCGCVNTITQKDAEGKTLDIGIILLSPYTQSKNSHKFMCFCGVEFESKINNIWSGEVSSCGCLKNINDIHERLEKLNVSLVDDYKGSHKSHTFQCKCGNKFGRLMHHVLYDKRTTCGCDTKSNGELLVRNILNSIDIDYIEEYTFKDCRNERLLRFDFYIPDYNICIEYNGRQHYEPIEFFGGISSFHRQMENDSLKRQYCCIYKKNLLILKYNESYRDIYDKISNLIAK